MCLKIEKNDDFVNKMKSNKTKEITCWKIYQIISGPDVKILLSAFKKNSVRFFGIVKSDRIDKNLNEEEIDKKTIDYGIHVFTDKKEAETYLQGYYEFAYACNKIVPVTCKLNDFVAAGTYYSAWMNSSFGSAVFSKVRIRSKTWCKIFPTFF